MIKHFILFILLSLGSVTTAFAIPTVSEIESTIGSGDYKEARSKLNEVLKVHPDSVVANKYMLEIIKIEYAGSLQPSVEFKIYEDKLKQIEVKKQQKILQEQEVLVAKKRAEFKAKVKSFFNFILILCIFAVVFYFLYLVFIKHYNKIVENMKHAKWKAKVVSETNHFNTIFLPVFLFYLIYILNKINRGWKNTLLIFICYIAFRIRKYSNVKRFFFVI